MDALATRIARAEQARLLLDVEAQVDTDAGEVRTAQEKVKQAEDELADAAAPKNRCRGPRGGSCES